MAKPRRKCKLVNSDARDKTDLRRYEKQIVDTINATVQGKNPEVFATCFSTDPLTQSEAVAVGRALAKIPELYVLGKTVTTFRLFDGKTYLEEDSQNPKNDQPVKPVKPKQKGGRMESKTHS